MSAPVHILHIMSTFGLGGPQTRTCDLINALGPGFAHTIVAVDGTDGAASRIGPDAACRVIRAPAGKGGMLYSLAMRRLLRQLRPGVLVTYNWGAFDAVMAGCLSRVCPVLHVEDGFGSDEAARLKSRRVWFRRAFLNSTYAVVVPSKTLLDVAVERYWVRRGRVRWIVNGVDTGTFTPARNRELRQRLGASDKDVLVGYCGRLGPEKNLDLLLRSFAAGAPANAILAIIGDGGCRMGLQRLARELGIEARVRFTGFQNPAPWYGALDVFAMSSITEQMPMSLLEAMACGLPAVCTDVGDCAAVLDGGGAVVRSGDLQAYTEAIRTFAGSEELRKSAGARNRQRAVDRFSFDQMVSAYADLFLTAARA